MVAIVFLPPQHFNIPHESAQTLRTQLFGCFTSRILDGRASGLMGTELHTYGRCETVEGQFALSSKRC